MGAKISYCLYLCMYDEIYTFVCVKLGEVKRVYRKPICRPFSKVRLYVISTASVVPRNLRSDWLCYSLFTRNRPRVNWAVVNKKVKL